MASLRSVFCVWALSAAGGAMAFAQTDAMLAGVAEKQDWKKVKLLLEQKADVAAAQADGMTALHWAVYHDEPGAAALLIKAGASAKVANRYGVTPLSLACKNGNAATVERLLAAGADCNTTLPGGETALMSAARTGRPGPVKLLLAKGAKVDAKDRKGQTALMWAAAQGNAEVVSILVQAGADCKARLPSGFTPLLFAAREGRMEVVKVLLRAGVAANEAIEVKKGVARGPKSGTSGLHLAVENGHFELAVALVEAGADPNDQRCGYGPLQMISWVRKPSRGDDDEGDPPPIGSGMLTSLDCVKKLVALGANVNLPSKGGVPGRGVLSRPGAAPLLAAALTADLALMELLVSLGADLKTTNSQKTTLLMAAAGVGVGAPEEAAGNEPEVLEVVRFLLKRGADPNAVDTQKETAMHGAAYRNHPKVVQLLADAGAKVEVWNQKNQTGLTPVVIAEGHRPGLNFRPSPETVAALHRVMLAAGVTPPKPLPIPSAPPLPDAARSRSSP